MAKKRNSKKNKKVLKKEKKSAPFRLPEESRRLIFGIVMLLIAVIFIFSFFDLAGGAGKILKNVFTFLIGNAFFTIPLLLILAGFVFLTGTDRKKIGRWSVILAICLIVLGICGILGTFGEEIKQGGWLGYIISWIFLEAFGILVARIIFGAVITVGLVVIFQSLWRPGKKPAGTLAKPENKEPSLIKRIFEPKFKVKGISSISKEEPIITFPKEVPSGPEKPTSLELRTKPVSSFLNGKKYQFPPIDLLEEDGKPPMAGDIRINSAIIKKTLQNFDIPVEMSEVNIGPTVTQYTLKPAEGVKLSKITVLSNDLSLALASHPIRIEAPIPGKPLVGIEVPNKVRAVVRLRNLVENPNFQNSLSNLTLVLGKNVSGYPVFADLAKMPHLLVAGATGTGKTICLNTIILSLLYQNSPDILRFILIDPKRVEFPVYNDLPHLLCPVISDVQKSVLALKWLTGEMERRFKVLAKVKARDIVNYNEIVLKEEGGEPLPYIVLIIDELADLMAARGREIEAGIVRLAQMARAVGIHLIVATQRPSVEVITGLIKANVTSRITFQVASQVDSRTVLDMAGAEKLLGAGDMLFVSAEITKPKRIQCAYVSEKEIRRVTNFIKSKNKEILSSQEEAGGDLLEKRTNDLSESLKENLESEESSWLLPGEEDPLYEEAKRVVVESRKASASLLQRRLRIGYARAARLIDTLEERGVVGPGEGAKPREVYVPESD